MNAKQFRALLDSKNLSPTDAAVVTFKNRATIFRYLNGELDVPPGVVALVEHTERRETKPREPGYPGVWLKDRPAAKPKPKAKRNGRKA